MESIDQLQSIAKIVSRQHSFTIDDLSALPIQAIGEGRYIVWVDGRAITLHCDSAKCHGRTYTFKIDQAAYEVRLQRLIDLRVSDMGFQEVIRSTATEIYAPIPGLIKVILVQPGDIVVMGQPLIMLEAMKMENMIKANYEGKILTIAVASGQTVDKGQLLIKFAN